MKKIATLMFLPLLLSDSQDSHSIGNRKKVLAFQDVSLLL